MADILCRVLYRVGSCRNVLKSRLSAVHSASFQYAGSKVNMDDLRALPEKPKKPLTPYFRFMAQMRPELKRVNPDSKVTDLVKLVADEWEKASPEIRQKLSEEYKKDLMNYTSERNKYEELLTEEQKDLIKKAKNETEMIKEKRKLKKKMKELGKPRRPVSAFLAFFNSKIHSRGNTPYQEWIKKLAKDWSNLPPELKASYVRESSTAMETHRRQLQEWEERMIRMGHIDVVRSEALIEPKPSRKVIKTSEKNK